MADAPKTPRKRAERRPKQESSRRGVDQPPSGFRGRLRTDRFLFALCLAFLAFTTWALAVTWRLMGDPLLLALAVVSVLPAFYLFYLRDGSAA